MANTYSQIYIQLIFAVHGRQSLISKFHREELQQFITGIVQKREQKMLSVFCMPDHTHLLIGLNPKTAVSDLVRDIKAGSSKYINDRHWLNRKFSWQAGFGAFSYSKSQIDRVVKYILNQEQHHHKSTFKEEYIDFLKKFEIEFDEKYFFEFIDH